MRREGAAAYMLGETPRAPSCFARVCHLQCAEERRRASGLGDVPALRGLAGLTLQRGAHATAGSLQTLKFSRWDAATRTATVPVFGACGEPATAGVWTEPVTPVWHGLVSFARSCNYTYEFRFSEDFTRADIGIKSNLCCICPCLPAWCAVPGGVARFDMVQAEGSVDGSHWLRHSSKCGAPMAHTYDLVEVVRADLSPGPHHGDLASPAPAALLLSR